MQHEYGRSYKFGKRRMKKFHGLVQDEWYHVKFDNTWHTKKVADLMGQIDGLFNGVLAEVKARGVHDNDLVRVHIRHPDIIKRGDIVVPLRPMHEMRAESITEALQAFLQSDDSLAFDEDFEIGVGTIRIPRGSGTDPVIKTNGPRCCLARKKSIVKIINDEDNLCFARSMAVCEARALYEERKIAKHTYDDMCRPSRKNQLKRALALQVAAGVGIAAPVDITEIKAFEDLLDAQIIVLSAARANAIWYAGSKTRDRKYFVYLVPAEVEGMCIICYYIIF